jgi:hypothetical protein
MHPHANVNPGLRHRRAESPAGERRPSPTPLHGQLSRRCRSRNRSRSAIHFRNWQPPPLEAQERALNDVVRERGSGKRGRYAEPAENEEKREVPEVEAVADPAQVSQWTICDEAREPPLRMEDAPTNHKRRRECEYGYVQPDQGILRLRKEQGGDCE